MDKKRHDADLGLPPKPPASRGPHVLARYERVVATSKEAKVARAAVELANRFDGGYEQAQEQAAVAVALAEAALEAFHLDVPEVTPVVVRLACNPAAREAQAREAIALKARAAELAAALEPGLRNTPAFTRVEFDAALKEQRAYARSQTLAHTGGGLSRGTFATPGGRSGAYVEAVQHDIQRNLRWCQLRYAKAAGKAVE